MERHCRMTVRVYYSVYADPYTTWVLLSWHTTAWLFIAAKVNAIANQLINSVSL